MSKKRYLEAEMLKEFLRMGMKVGHIHTLLDVENYIDTQPEATPQEVAGQCWRNSKYDPPTEADADRLGRIIVWGAAAKHVDIILGECNFSPCGRSVLDAVACSAGGKSRMTRKEMFDLRIASDGFRYAVRKALFECSKFPPCTERMIVEGRLAEALYFSERMMEKTYKDLETEGKANVV